MRPFPQRFSPPLAGVFFFSGFASLIYQVVWQRLLSVHYGVGAISITLIVSAYMLGLGLGSLLGGRLAEGRRDPYVIYAAVEAALGLIGLISFPLILAFGRFAAVNTPTISFIWIFAFLCIPTILMGITLPLLTTIYTRTTNDFLYSICHLYFINTLGAAFGVFISSYVLISLIGLNGCSYLAATVNFMLAAVIFAARNVQKRKVAPPPIENDSPTPSWGWHAYILVFITGFIAIGYEIIWYRVVGVLVKDSPYEFSSVLFVYLLGIALGSLAIHKYLARRPHTFRKGLFFSFQFLIGLSVLLIFIGYYYLAQHAPIRWLSEISFSKDMHPSLSLFTRRPSLRSWVDVYLLVDVFLWPVVFVFMPALLMGASFPLISSLALSRRGGEGRAVGTVYFFGVLGNVFGGLLTGFMLLPVAGTERTVLAFGLLGILFFLAPHISSGWRVPGVWRFGVVLALVFGAIAAFPRPGKLYEVMHVPPFASGIARFDEGLDAVVLTYQEGEIMRNFINGQGHGYRPSPLFYAEAIEGLSFAPSARKILVIGFGTGTIAEVALMSAEVERVTVVELCGTLIKNLRKFPMIVNILEDHRIQTVIDDGRRFLLRTEEKYDVILMDPLRTTTAYSNNLHSRQFFALASKHLTHGGVLMVGGVGDSRVIRRTLLAEYPYVRAYDGFNLASKSPLQQNRKHLEFLLGPFPAEMQTAIWDRTQDALEGATLAKATAGWPINQDWLPVSEYYLALPLRQWIAAARIQTPDLP